MDFNQSNLIIYYTEKSIKNVLVAAVTSNFNFPMDIGIGARACCPKLSGCGKLTKIKNSYNCIIQKLYNIFLIRSDLAGFTARMTTCVDGGGIVVKGGECEYSCQVSGLDPDDTFTIAKARILYYSLGLREG